MVVLPAENYTFGLPVQTFEYKRDAEFRTADLHADVHLPPASVKRPASGWPVLLVVHGGGFITGCLKQLPAQQVDYLLAGGVAVVDIEYRLAPHASIHDMNDDVLAAHDWVRSSLNSLVAKEGETIIDGSKIAATGDSAGGYLVNQLGVTAKPPLKAIAPFYGLSDFSTLAYGNEDALYLGYNEEETAYIKETYSLGTQASITPDWTLPAPRTEWRKAVFACEALINILVPNDSVEARKAVSPIHLATSSYPPTFFAIPQFDPTVAPSQSWRFADKLKKLGVEVETGRAKDGLHCYDRKGGPLNAEGGHFWEDVTKPALQFLINHLTV